jgi:hypothetical protein
MPDAYTARNIAVTVRTILIGLLYLITFIFSANAVGLTGEGGRLCVGGGMIGVLPADHADSVLMNTCRLPRSTPDSHTRSTSIPLCCRTPRPVHPDAVLPGFPEGR